MSLITGCILSTTTCASGPEIRRGAPARLSGAGQRRAVGPVRMPALPAPRIGYGLYNRLSAGRKGAPGNMQIAKKVCHGRGKMRKRYGLLRCPLHKEVDALLRPVTEASLRALYDKEKQRNFHHATFWRESPMDDGRQMGYSHFASLKRSCTLRRIRSFCIIVWLGSQFRLLYAMRSGDSPSHSPRHQDVFPACGAQGFMGFPAVPPAMRGQSTQRASLWSECSSHDRYSTTRLRWHMEVVGPGRKWGSNGLRTAS